MQTNKYVRHGMETRRVPVPGTAVAYMAWEEMCEREYLPEDDVPEVDSRDEQ